MRSRYEPDQLDQAYIDGAPGHSAAALTFRRIPSACSHLDRRSNRTAGEAVGKTGDRFSAVSRPGVLSSSATELRCFGLDGEAVGLTARDFAVLWGQLNAHDRGEYDHIEGGPVTATTTCPSL